MSTNNKRHMWWTKMNGINLHAFEINKAEQWKYFSLKSQDQHGSFSDEWCDVIWHKTKEEKN